MREELTRAKADLEYARLCGRKEKEAKEVLARDLDRLLDVALESQRGGGGAGREGGREKVEEVYKLLEGAYEEIDLLEARARESKAKSEEREKEVERLQRVVEELQGAQGKKEVDVQEVDAQANRVELLEKEVTELKQQLAAASSAMTPQGCAFRSPCLSLDHARG